MYAFKVIMILVVTTCVTDLEGLNYVDLIQHFEERKCTKKQYAALVIGGNRSPQEVDCGSDVNESPSASFEGTSTRYEPGMAILTRKCFVVCTGYDHKAYHAEGGLIANANLLRELMEGGIFKKIWLLTYREPCGENFHKSAREVVINCASKIADFCRRYKGRVTVLFDEVFSRQTRTVSEQDIARRLSECAAYQKTVLPRRDTFERKAKTGQKNEAYACGTSFASSKKSSRSKRTAQTCRKVSRSVVRDMLLNKVIQTWAEL